MSVWLYGVVEGQTEETFFRTVLRPHLAAHNVWVYASQVTTSRDRGTRLRGGMTAYGRVKTDLSNWMRQDKRAEARFTTMFDFYRLPQDFPGWLQSANFSDPRARVRVIEESFAQDVNDLRFIPYIQMHEFEALLFTDVTQLQIMYPSDKKAIAALAQVGHAYDSPEDIDLRHPPSKRILEHLGTYNKPAAGPIVTEIIGLDRIRRACAHFGEWLSKLESLK